MLKSENLQGNWRSPEIETIENPDGSVMYIEREAVFADDNWDIFIRSFLDNKGNEAFFTIHAMGNYILEGESQYVKGATCVDFNNTGRYVTPHHTALVDMLNETSFDTEWMIDQEHDVSINGCALVPSVDDCPVEYDIILLKENKIYFGEFTPEQREKIKKFSLGETDPSEGSMGICSTENRPRQLIKYPMVRK
jgi:hypothetical protein